MVTQLQRPLRSLSRFIVLKQYRYLAQQKSFNIFDLLFTGSFSFYTQLRVGYVCIFSLKNPSYPEYICHASSGVISFDIHPQHPNMVVVGLYNGNVAVYNLRTR